MDAFPRQRGRTFVARPLNHRGFPELRPAAHVASLFLYSYPLVVHSHHSSTVHPRDAHPLLSAFTGACQAGHTVPPTGSRMRPPFSARRSERARTQPGAPHGREWWRSAKTDASTTHCTLGYRVDAQVCANKCLLAHTCSSATTASVSISDASATSVPWMSKLLTASSAISRHTTVTSRSGPAATGE